MSLIDVYNNVFILVDKFNKDDTQPKNIIYLTNYLNKGFWFKFGLIKTEQISTGVKYTLFEAYNQIPVTIYQVGNKFYYNYDKFDNEKRFNDPENTNYSVFTF